MGTKTIQMAQRIEQWPVDRLIPYARNARTHSAEQVAKIAASIVEFGFTNPILVDGNDGIIAGHGRLMAARKLGMTEVPVIELTHLTEAQKRAYILADNRLALDAGWDEEMLAAEMADLKDMEFDLALTGFTDAELADLLQEPETTEAQEGEDDAPEIPYYPTSVTGDVWVCGPHRVMCGDSTSIDAFALLMNGAVADMVFTDPPYGMSYDGGRGKQGFGMIANDDATGDDLIALVRDALLCVRSSSKPDAAAYVCFPWRTYAEFEKAVIAAGFAVNACIVWDKQSFGLGHQDYRPQHEFIFYSKGGMWYGDRSQSDVWYCKRESHGSYVHPTQKPVELIERALVNSSKRGDVVIDCFGGSGSTLIGCEKTSRAARIMELDPKYVDVIVKRWQALSGKQAVLEGDGRTFDQMVEDRKPIDG